MLCVCLFCLFVLFCFCLFLNNIFSLINKNPEKNVSWICHQRVIFIVMKKPLRSEMSLEIRRIGEWDTANRNVPEVDL